jgi:hypothetical protein
MNILEMFISLDHHTDTLTILAGENATRVHIPMLPDRTVGSQELEVASESIFVLLLYQVVFSQNYLHLKPMARPPKMV